MFKKISSKIYLIPYISILVALCLVGLDLLFLDRFIGDHLPRTSDQLLLLNVVFNLPHIIASALLFGMNREYIVRLRSGLLLGLIIAAFLAYLMTFNSNEKMKSGLLAFYALFTIYHVVGQQFGIGRAFLSMSQRSFVIWKWLGVLLALVIFSKIYLSLVLPQNILVVYWSFIFIYFLVSARIFYSLFGWTSKMILLSNTLLVLVPIGLEALQYSFFATLIPRVIHDFTAFGVYFFHNLNRRLQEQPNQKVSFLFVTGVTVFLPILLALPMTLGYGRPWTLTLAYSLALFHYYTEAFYWKGASPLRQYVQFSKA